MTKARRLSGLQVRGARMEARLNETKIDVLKIKKRMRPNSSAEAGIGPVSLGSAHVCPEGPGSPGPWQAALAACPHGDREVTSVCGLWWYWVDELRPIALNRRPFPGRTQAPGC